MGRRQCKTTLLGAQSFMPAEQQQQNYSILASVIWRDLCMVHFHGFEV